MKIFVVLWIVLVLTLSTLSQTPVSIEVTSLTIEKAYLRFPAMSMSVNGLPAPYQSPLVGYGGGLIGSLESCRPCYLGNSFTVSFNSDSSFYGFNIQGYGENKRVKFTLLSSSPNVVLSPTIRRKNRTVIQTVPAYIKGKIEIFDGNTLIAVDNSVEMSGTLKADFVQYLLNSSNNERRGFDFRSLTLSYSR